jgi:hypothetical protein
MGMSESSVESCLSATSCAEECVPEAQTEAASSLNDDCPSPDTEEKAAAAAAAVTAAAVATDLCNSNDWFGTATVGTVSEMMLGAITMLAFSKALFASAANFSLRSTDAACGSLDMYSMKDGVSA